MPKPTNPDTSGISAEGRVLSPTQTRDERQAEVYAWVLDTFGSANAISEERMLRFFEEAVELCQAEGAEIEALHELIGYVYSRPAGNVFQELGGVGVTLLAYAASKGSSADGEEYWEAARCFGAAPEEMRERHNQKARLGVAVPCADDTQAGEILSIGRNSVTIEYGSLAEMLEELLALAHKYRAEIRVKPAGANAKEWTASFLRDSISSPLLRRDSFGIDAEGDSPALALSALFGKVYAEDKLGHLHVEERDVGYDQPGDWE